MKNIKENIRKLGYKDKVTWATDEKDVYLETWTASRTIDLRPQREELLNTELMPHEIARIEWEMNQVESL